MHRLWRCRNSIGSSIVRMCSERFRLISSMMAASVVDLPEPVGPVTRTRPRGFSASWCRVAGMPSSSSVLISAGNRVREVELALDLEILLLLAREDAVEQLLRLLRREGAVVGHALDFSTHANDRRRSNGHM